MVKMYGTKTKATKTAWMQEQQKAKRSETKRLQLLTGGEQLQVPAPGNLVLTGISDRPHWDQTELALILTDEVVGVVGSVNESEIFNSSPASLSQQVRDLLDRNIELCRQNSYFFQQAARIVVDLSDL